MYLIHEGAASCWNPFILGSGDNAGGFCLLSGAWKEVIADEPD